eukprot:CAMPEP_0117467904 /NCGR_PEP_ID=MMETSP0784-20121206/5900_1 /TAXON_ID=39447 /ORGANISM="" /LENGTH=824 /DNA_ID=CAMNT_0005261895 /DNA_START=16 /DNA_END=2488 /DNA_ORIENTATION=+
MGQPRARFGNEWVLRLLVPGEWGGRLIGRQGSRIQETQARSGSRIQLTDVGDEKLVEISGSRHCVDEAVQLMVHEFVRAADEGIHGHRHGREQEAVPRAGRHVSISALVPTKLAEWIEGANSGESPLKVPGLSVALVGSYEIDSTDRRLALQGPTSAVCRTLKLLCLRLRYHARWAWAGSAALPWELCNQQHEGDPASNFVSAENFRLGLPFGTDREDFFSQNKKVLTQIQEDTGAVIRVQTAESGRPPCVEIAGTFGAKLPALLEVASLLVLTGRQTEEPSAETHARDCILKILLPESSPSAIETEEIDRCAASFGACAMASGKRCGDLLSVTIVAHARVACCAAVMAVARASERRAAAHEAEHGPPPLIIDYLTRWCGKAGARFASGTSSDPQCAVTNGHIASAAAIAARAAKSMRGVAAGGRVLGGRPSRVVDPQVPDAVAPFQELDSVPQAAPALAFECTSTPEPCAGKKCVSKPKEQASAAAASALAVDDRSASRPRALKKRPPRANGQGTIMKKRKKRVHLPNPFVVEADLANTPFEVSPFVQKTHGVDGGAADGGGDIEPQVVDLGDRVHDRDDERQPLLGDAPGLDVGWLDGDCDDGRNPTEREDEVAEIHLEATAAVACSTSHQMLGEGEEAFAEMYATPREAIAPRIAELAYAEGELWVYQPANGMPMDIRSEPRIAGRRTRSKIFPDEKFRVCETLTGEDAVMYLKLADGRGWVFSMKPGVGNMCWRLADEDKDEGAPERVPEDIAARAKLQAKNLPKGWTAHSDAEGRTFYSNAETGRSQWELPGALPWELLQAPQAAPEVAVHNDPVAEDP